MKRGSRFAMLAKGLKRTRGERNNNEAAYERHLENEKAAGRVVAWWFEPASFRVTACDKGQPVRYSPDFMVLGSDGTVYLDDVKAQAKRGKTFDDPASLVRIKTAADAYPLFVWRLVRPIRGGAWDVQEV